MNTDKQPRLLLSAHEAAEELSMSEKSLHKLTKARKTDAQMNQPYQRLY